MEAAKPLRAVRSWEEVLPGDSEVRVLEAMLLTVGERGYAKATVREVCERSGISQDSFHRRFGSKEACFSRAYEEAAERLATEVREACQGAASWRGAFRAGLGAALRFVAEQPLLARALLLEVRAVRGDAWLAHQRYSEELLEALDTARAERGARPDASPMIAGFVVGALEESLAVEIAAGRAAEVERLADDLARVAFLQLFGEE